MVRLTQQLVSGLFFLAFGGVAFGLASQLTIGTAADMGSGYAPRMLAVGCLLVGALQVGGALLRPDGSEGVSIAIGPLLLVTAMVVGFAVLLPWLGLPLTVIVVVLGAAISGEAFGWAALIGIALVLAGLTTVLFGILLKLQIQLLPWFLVT